eukprot:6852033-Alexandrium_andersonii.AAC.1
MTTPAADLAMLREAKAQNVLGLVQRAWVGEVCDAKHMLALGFRGGSGAGGVSWYAALHRWPKSAALLWP